MHVPQLSIRAALRSISVLGLAAVALSLLAFGVVPRVNAAPVSSLALSKDQIEKIRDLGVELDSKMKPELARNEKLTKAMQANLVEIVGLKTAAEKRGAVRAYQEKYRKDYQGMLAKAGVDLQQIAARLRNIVPNTAFLVTPNLTIEGRSRILAAFPAAAPSSTTSSRSLEFVDEKSLSCGAIAGGDVAFTSRSVTNSAHGAVVGGCVNEATKTAALAVPAGATAVRLDASAKLAVSAFVASIGLSCGAYGGAGFSATSGSHGIGNYNGISVSVYALIAWTAYAEDSIDPANMAGNVPLQGNATLVAETATSAIAIVGISAASASAEITNIDAALTTQF